MIGMFSGCTSLKTLNIANFSFEVVIVGGYAAISYEVNQIQLMGDMGCHRLAGDMAYETSDVIAKWCLTKGMAAVNVGIATGSDYYDALAGAAFCGKN